MDLQKLGIDWQSIIFYLINYGVLFAILGYYVIPKIWGKLEDRQKNIADNIEEANRLKENFQQKLEEIQKEKADAHTQMQAEMKKMHETIESKKAELISDMEAKRNKLIEDTQTEMAEKQKLLLQETEARTLEIIKQAVLYVVQNKIPENVIDESVSEAWSKYKN
ncbi:hypothetical protein GF376_04090 [Candidatus Peregrinibacteria bacterium]|nr:hypothetical protein [Candidatus Peregrinibacteria bacterium]